MDILEYLELRISKGKITDMKPPESQSKGNHPDYDYCHSFGKDMVEFWEKANNQKALLWAMRGLGMDEDADLAWKCFSQAHDIVLHRTVITPEVALEGAKFIRDVYKNPFKMLPGYVWQDALNDEVGYTNRNPDDTEETEVVHVHFMHECPCCDFPKAGTSMFSEQGDYLKKEFRCQLCGSTFILEDFEKFSILKLNEAGCKKVWEKAITVYLGEDFFGEAHYCEDLKEALTLINNSPTCYARMQTNLGRILLDIEEGGIRKVKGYSNLGMVYRTLNDRSLMLSVLEEGSRYLEYRPLSGNEFSLGKII
jgi:transposase-like protein